MEIVKTIQSVRDSVKAARDSGKSIGLVPTMGALHTGHISLIEAAKKQSDYVAVSIFVNPTQFGAGEDLEKYPRPIEKDFEICRKSGVDIVFAPTFDVMYKSKNVTCVNVEKLTEPLCGRSRQGHFRGVTTVCAKLFNIVCPDIAFFGQKDAQQAIVIKRMAADLNMPLEIAMCPTVREESGLAVSSRNEYLTDSQRNDAAFIYKSLQKCREMAVEGAVKSEPIISEMRRMLDEIVSIQIEYISIVDAETLEDIDIITNKGIAAVAVKIGETRLIDNIIVDVKEK